MTIIEKSYTCNEDQDDVFVAVVDTEDHDVMLSINDRTRVILTEKKIRKLIKQLKKALPKEEKEEKEFAISDLDGNIKVGDRVRLLRSGGRLDEGTVVKTDFGDSLMPLYIQVDGINYWPVLGRDTRVVKIN